MSSAGDNSDPRDYKLDISGMGGGAGAAPEETGAALEQAASARKIPFISIHFRCCGVYAPIYRNAEATAYAGHCPKCRRALSVPIGPGGTTSRTFTAG